MRHHFAALRNTGIVKHSYRDSLVITVFRIEKNHNIFRTLLTTNDIHECVAVNRISGSVHPQCIARVHRYQKTLLRSMMTRDGLYEYIHNFVLRID